MRSGRPASGDATRHRRERRPRAVGGWGHGPQPDGSTFLRGLSIGALVGAVIAGSTIWERWRRRRATRPSEAAARAGDGPAALGGPRS